MLILSKLLPAAFRRARPAILARDARDARDGEVPQWSSRLRRGGICLAISVLPAFGSVGSMAQGTFETSVTVALEAEEKSCQDCGNVHRENEIEVTPVELVLRPTARPELSFGLEITHDVESEGGLFSSGRTMIESDDAFKLWARRDINETVWARVQTEVFTSEKLFDLGGRLGFGTDLGPNSEVSGYLNVDRRFAMTGGDSTQEGTFVELRVQPEWDFDTYGAWVEFRANAFTFDGAREDEMRVSVEPGVWIALGDSPHKGVAWLEAERRTRAGSSDFRRDTQLLGLGVELDLGKRRELFVGARAGTERDTRADRAPRKMTVQGFILEYKTRF